MKIELTREELRPGLEQKLNAWEKIDKHLRFYVKHLERDLSLESLSEVQKELIKGYYAMVDTYKKVKEERDKLLESKLG